jgi:hypothetical protein
LLCDSHKVERLQEEENKDELVQPFCKTVEEHNEEILWNTTSPEAERL